MHTSENPVIGVMLDRTEVAALIGVTPRTISQMTQSGRLLAYKFNDRLTRYRRDDIAKWIESAKYHPQAA